MKQTLFAEHYSECRSGVHNVRTNVVKPETSGVVRGATSDSLI